LRPHDAKSAHTALLEQTANAPTVELLEALPGEQRRRLVIEHDRLHREHPARLVLDAPLAQRFAQLVPGDREQPNRRRLRPRLVVRHRLERGRERHALPFSRT
jgi:hypothetical protein